MSILGNLLYWMRSHSHKPLSTHVGTYEHQPVEDRLLTYPNRFKRDLEDSLISELEYVR
ncbi:hypothetical protein [cf. Phormidesmis sp. LEGE 11477]|uniref:hypothetical protein n=1 Tax=cf. Phormidesmis sp. LEGE 11477 TaxID=1828680 RepID=UPI00188117CA|nr:hypothetical protein [cf. Phormidesmis sp. LEGE 11477]MBE9060629.1 hypothetical protein [cf. Phormidesmis sp. LEGE 11477]